MRYLMLVAMDPEGDANESDEGTLPIDEWVAKYDATGSRILGDRIRPASQSTTVRRRGGKVLVTDGPFAETREWVVGLDILECDDLDHAIAIAAEHPQAVGGCLELRPFWPLENGS